MIYFMDTNVLIEADKYHFGINDRQDYWNWLLSLAKEGQFKVPEAVYDEVKAGGLADWLEAHKDVLFCGTQECMAALREVAETYGTLSEEELEILKADPYIIAHAIIAGGAVVTHERPKNATVLKNMKIPTICKSLGVPCLTLPSFMWEMRHTLPE